MSLASNFCPPRLLSLSSTLFTNLKFTSGLILPHDKLLFETNYGDQSRPNPIVFSYLKSSPYTYQRFCPSNLNVQVPLVPISPLSNHLYYVPFSCLSDIIKPLNQDYHATSNLNQTLSFTLINRASESNRRETGCSYPDTFCDDLSDYLIKVSP